MSSVDQLVQRLSAEVAAVTERVHVLQTKAAKGFLDQEQRFVHFIALADRIDAILQPRIEAFTKLNVFKDIKQNVSLELRGPENQCFHGRTIKLSVPSEYAGPRIGTAEAGQDVIHVEAVCSHSQH